MINPRLRKLHPDNGRWLLLTRYHLFAVYTDVLGVEHAVPILQFVDRRRRAFERAENIIQNG